MKELLRALQKRGVLPVAECPQILPQVARGLNAAHELRIIHRDLKANNIFLTLSGDVGATLVIVLGRPQGLR